MPTTDMEASFPPIFSKEDEFWMGRALILAKRGIGCTSPNPPVGAVIVKDGKQLGAGWHKAAGKPHAEIEALNSLPARHLAKGATLYVTLEPCSTFGRTPPCTEAIIESGIQKVVWAMDDPNPKHCGRARRILENAGIEVQTGVLNEEVKEILRPWSKYITSGRPWVILKGAMSLDGRIVPPSPRKFVTSKAARQDAMQIRATVDGILVGGATLRADNPRLTIRGIGKSRNRPQPYRFVWTKAPDQLPRSSNVFQDNSKDRTVIISSPDFFSLLQEIKKYGVVSLLVEGGGIVHGAVIDSKLVDEVYVYLAPKIFGGPTPFTKGIGATSSSDAIRFERVEIKVLGDELRIRGLVKE